MDLALNNLQRLICHKTQQTKPNHSLYNARERERERDRNWPLRMNDRTVWRSHQWLQCRQIGSEKHKNTTCLCVRTFGYFILSEVVKAWRNRTLLVSLLLFIVIVFLHKPPATKKEKEADRWIGIIVLANDSGDRSSILGWIIPKPPKWYLILPCLRLRIITYESRVSGAIQGKELCPPLHLGVVAIEKGGIRWPSTMDGQLLYLYQLLRMNKVWYKVNVLSGVLRFGFTVYLLDQLP